MCEEEGEKLHKFEYLENEKSFLDLFFIVFEGLSFDQKNKNLIKIGDISFKDLHIPVTF